MRYVLAVYAIFLALCSAPAFADSVTFSNQGILSSSVIGGIYVQSGLTGFSFNGIPQGPIPGALVLNTGSLIGSLLGGGTISAGNLEIDIDGFPGTGAIFASTFSGTWSPLGGGLFELLGTFSGDLGGLQYHGGTDQVFQINFFEGQACFRDLSGATTVITAVPEPGTLALLGTGLAGIGSAMRRKFRKQSRESYKL